MSGFAVATRPGSRSNNNSQQRKYEWLHNSFPADTNRRAVEWSRLVEIVASDQTYHSLHQQIAINRRWRRFVNDPRGITRVGECCETLRVGQAIHAMERLRTTAFVFGVSPGRVLRSSMTLLICRPCGWSGVSKRAIPWYAEDRLLGDPTLSELRKSLSRPLSESTGTVGRFAGINAGTCDETCCS